jgi:hypothetical protein
VIPIDALMRKSVEGRDTSEHAVAADTPTRPTSAPRRPAPTPPITAAPHLPALDAFLKDAKEFAETSATLLTSTHGLLDERVILSHEDRQRLLDHLAFVREAIGKMEAQARRSAISAA